MVTKGNNIAAEMVCKARLHRTHGTLDKFSRRFC